MVLPRRSSRRTWIGILPRLACMSSMFKLRKAWGQVWPSCSDESNPAESKIMCNEVPRGLETTDHTVGKKRHRDFDCNLQNTRAQNYPGFVDTSQWLPALEHIRRNTSCRTGDRKTGYRYCRRTKHPNLREFPHSKEHPRTDEQTSQRNKTAIR
jgi:hypothetical protein